MTWQVHMIDRMYANELIATDAVLTTSGGSEIHLRALDETKGANTVGHGFEFQTLQPGARVRMIDLVGLDISEDVMGGQLLLNGRTWNIQSYRYYPYPDAPVATGGELTLLLIGTGE